MSFFADTAALAPDVLEVLTARAEVARIAEAEGVRVGNVTEGSGEVRNF